MALLHKAELVPSLIEVLTAWLPRQRWAGGADVSTLAPVGAYRLNDPAGTATATVIDAGCLVLTVRRLLDAHDDLNVDAGQQALRGTWPGNVEPVILATVRHRGPT